MKININNFVGVSIFEAESFHECNANLILRFTGYAYWIYNIRTIENLESFKRYNVLTFKTFSFKHYKLL